MKAWKESASLILAARSSQQCNATSPLAKLNYDYNLLCLKRHQKSSFMPGLYVFPGGEISPADSNLKWHKLFSAFDFDKNTFKSLFVNNGARPEIFEARRNELPREISLRITAIRETFEECGVLLCRSSRKDVQSSWAQHFSIPKHELQDWRNKVHSDAEEFYALCEKFKCYPDLWSLHEWSNWLTSPYKMKKRFDTAFYVTCMLSAPPASFENTEMADLKWVPPSDVISPTSNMFMAPPQLYEILRIANFENVDSLLSFARDRQKMGVKRYLPAMMASKDGHVGVLPGDSQYPKDLSSMSELITEHSHLTMKEFREISPINNRIEFLHDTEYRLVVQNFENSEGHPSPFQKMTLMKARSEKSSKSKH